MRRSRIRIVHKSCPRCGKPVAGLNRPIHGSQATYARYQGICQDCITASEENQMLHEIGQNIVASAAPTPSKGEGR